MYNNLYSVKIQYFCLKEETQTKGRRAALCPPLMYTVTFALILLLTAVRLPGVALGFSVLTLVSFRSHLMRFNAK